MENIKYYIWLLLVFGTASPEISSMLSRFSDAQGVYKAFGANIAAAGAEYTEKAASVTLEEAEALARRISASGTLIITIKDRRYPEELKSISNPPCVLFAKGNAGLLRRRIVTVTGSRSMTESTLLNIERIMRGFDRGYAAAGSLTPGCDQMCFLTALKNHIPFIEIPPCGTERFYPQNSATLRSFLLRNGGLVLTEFLPDEKPSNANFIKRARIAAGITPVTLVFQAGAGSGTLNVAERSRCPLFVPPPDIRASEYAGTVAAARSGAPLFLGMTDIENAFSGKLVSHHGELCKKSAQPERAAKPDTAEKRKLPAEKEFSSRKHYEIYKILAEHEDAVSDEYLMERSGADRDTLEEIILDLEINGLVTCEPGNRYMAVTC